MNERFFIPIAITVLLLSVILFHEFVFVSYISILFFLGTFFFFCEREGLKLLFLDDTLKITILFFLGLLYWLLRVDNIDFDYLDYHLIVEKTFIPYHYLLAFFSFILGSTYQFSKYKLSIFKNVIFLYLLIFLCRIIVSISEFKYGNNLWAGTLYVSLLPVSCLVLSEKRNSYRHISLCFIFFAIIMLLISSRFAALCLVAGGILFYFLSRIKRYKIFFSQVFFVYFISMFALIWVYVGLENNGIAQVINNLSLSVFNKSLFSGRNHMWKDLLVLILEEPFWGHGTLQESSYYLSSLQNWRNLSSHNIYLELCLRGGLVGLVIFLSKLYFIGNVIFKNIDLNLAKLGAVSLFMVSLYGFSIEFILTQNVMINSIIWFFWGVVYGHCKSASMKNSSSYLV